jgi:hypothetical protein
MGAATQPTGNQFAASLLLEMEKLTRASIAEGGNGDSPAVFSLLHSAVTHPRHGAAVTSYLAQYLSRCLTGSIPNQPIYRCSGCGCSFTYDPADHGHSEFHP